MYFWLCDYNSRANRFSAALSTGVNVISIFDDAVRNNLVCVCVCYWIFYFLMKGKYRNQRHNFLFLGRTESGCNFALKLLELCCVVLCAVNQINRQTSSHFWIDRMRQPNNAWNVKSFTFSVTTLCHDIGFALQEVLFHRWALWIDP